MGAFKALRGVVAAASGAIVVLAMLTSATTADAVMANFSCEKTGSLESATGSWNLACGFQALHLDKTGAYTTPGR